MRCLFNKWIVVLMLLCLVFIQRADATDTIPIIRLGIQQGLSNNSIRCIYQDHKGLMWFGTYDGLNRYDGYQFTPFRNKLNDSASLPHNYIYTIHEDRHNQLWIGTSQGIAIYNSIYSKFKAAYVYPYRSNKKEKISCNVNAIESDSAGNVFMATNGWGLLVKKEGSDVASQLPVIVGKKERLWYSVQGLSIDRQGRIWLFIPDVGLCIFDKASHSIRPMNNEVKSVTSLEPDDEGNIWIGTYQGVYKYSIPINAITKHYREETGLTTNKVMCLFYDQYKNLWIGTVGGGLNMLSTRTGKFTYTLPGETDYDLSSESVYAILADNESRIWIGTVKGGINIIDPQKSRFQTVTHRINDRNSLVNNFVAAFHETNNGELLIGTDGGGVSIWNRQLNRFTNFSYDPANGSSISNNAVSCIRQDHLNDIWVATFGGGINKFNRSKGSFEHYACINDSTGYENKNAWLIYEDHDKKLWVTTFGAGKLYLFNRPLNRFQVFDQKLNDLVAITEDHQQALWAGNSHQLIRIDRKNRKHVYYEIGKPIRSIWEDRHHHLWLGTEGGGLILFDRVTGKIVSRYADADGLSNNGVLNIVEDEQGYLWLSTFNGLSRFDPATKQFRNFYQSDGLQSNQFSYNAALRLQSGELAFGGINGFNVFDPLRISLRNYMPPVLFTGVWINNRPGDDMDGCIVYTPGDDRIRALKVPYNQAILSFHFTALEYSSPEKIRYAYFLEGWDKGWNYAQNIRTINYNNIQEGSYTLRVKSTNAEGVWNTKEAIIKISVLPPWYRTWWAYLLYVSIAAAVVYVYFRYKTRQTKLEYEIKVAHINAEKEKEINEKRQSFFTNVSHEFRTPLTLIINPVKDLLKKKEVSSGHAELNVVYRNARRLLSLVDQLLLFRKAENHADQLRVTKLNFYELCREVWLCFIQQAKSKQIEYLFEATNPSMELFADRNKIEIIFYNLLSNAIKYTPEGGKVIFRLTESEETIEASVIDNGYGIPVATGDRLFEKFYQVRDKTIPAKPGFGIGLYLVKNFVDNHKGQINYESRPGKGTSFCVTLQKGNNHLAEQPVYEETKTDPFILKGIAAIEADLQPGKPFKQDKAGLEAIVTDIRSILVVDDNEQMRNYVAGIFSDQFTVYEAAKAEDGLTLAKQYLPDIIISDIVMDGMTGIELCRIIKDTPSLSHIPVILLTGSFSPESKLQGVEGGADDYITKPFEKELLLARVGSLLKNRQHLQKYFYNEITHQENSLKISAEYKEFLEACIAIVEKHMDNDAFSIQTLAAEIGMSHSRLYKKIKAISGQSANAFIRFIRLRKAAELLINTNYNINETAFYVGMKDVKYFREQFHKTFGMKPSEYIEKYRKAFGKNFNLNEKAVKPRED
jgi:signal transduction histidine kinase/ligand-binding sensor domain-containing protein/DNA-binding response OmpR family regulator